MDRTSTKCWFRSSEAAQTRHTCHNGPVWRRELWQLCLAYARYQSSFSLSLTKHSPHATGLFISIPPRAQDTVATPHARRLKITPGRDKAPARPVRAAPGGLSGRAARKPKRTNSRPAPIHFFNRITRGGHAA